MATDTAKPETGELEIVPLSAVGMWVAWSGDGMRIPGNHEDD